jgi:hypothetical protein
LRLIPLAPFTVVKTLPSFIIKIEAYCLQSFFAKVRRYIQGKKYDERAHKSCDYRNGTISFERIKMVLSKYQTHGEDMGDIQLIEKQIERLDDKAFAELAAWFADYENSRWDRQIEADSYTGPPLLMP